jgi:putative transposase
MIQQIRKRTESEDIAYSIHLFFNGLSLRNTSKALSRFITKSHTAIKDWIQKYKLIKIIYGITNVIEFIIDGIQLKVGSE